MKLHFYTDKGSSYSYDDIMDLDMKDDDILSSYKEYIAAHGKSSGSYTIEEYLSDNYSEDIVELLSDCDCCDLQDAIDGLFFYSTNGQFDWGDVTGSYYNNFDKMVSELKCDLQFDNDSIVSSFSAILNDGFSFVSSHSIELCLSNFYSGNGEPVGATATLEIIDKFMNNHSWHSGFYDKGNLITDIKEWSKSNQLIRFC